MTLRGWAADLLELLLPGGCVSCRRWIPRRASGAAELVCGPCRARMREASWPRCPRCHWPTGTGRRQAEGCRECADWPETLTAARFAYELASPVDDLVHGLKYEGWRELAPEMGDAVARLELPEAVLEGPRAVVPVPTTPRRLRSRGYNQAELLAERVSDALGLPLLRALARPAAADSQTTLHPDERRRNVRGAFVATPEARGVRGGTVLLVDDVLTTGATACAAADALTGAGARRVVALSYARAVGERARSAA